MTDDLPLFAWQPPAPPEPELLCWPLTRRKCDVERYARFFVKPGVTPKEQEFYWRKTLTHHRDKLTGRGFAPEIVDAQVNALAAAIEAEVRRLRFMAAVKPQREEVKR